MTVPLVKKCIIAPKVYLYLTHDAFWVVWVHKSDFDFDLHLQLRPHTAHGMDFEFDKLPFSDLSVNVLM